MQARSAENAPGPRKSTGRNITFIALIAIGTAVLVGASIKSALTSLFLGWDFPVFYISAHMPLSQLYDPAAFSAFWQQHLKPLGVPHWSPYVRPAVFSVLIRPLELLSYRTAFILWVFAGASAYAASLTVLIRRFHLPGFIVPAYAAFFPVIGGLASGQDNCAFLLAVILGLVLLETDHDWIAGIIFGCCLYKYNLILLIPMLLVAKRRFRALAGFGIFGGLVVAASAVFASPSQYLRLLNGISEISPFIPTGLRGATMALGITWAYVPLAIAVFVMCAWLMPRLPMPQAYCVAIIGVLLISPYVTWYDSTLLCLPIAAVIAFGSTTSIIVGIASLVLPQVWSTDNGPLYFTPAMVELLLLGFFIARARGADTSIEDGRVKTKVLSPTETVATNRVSPFTARFRATLISAAGLQKLSERRTRYF